MSYRYPATTQYAALRECKQVPWLYREKKRERWQEREREGERETQREGVLIRETWQCNFKPTVNAACVRTMLSCVMR